MKRFVLANPKLAASGAVGLLLFLALYGYAFMGEVRPQPLDRNQIILRALDFTAREGWNAADRVAAAIPIAGAARDRESTIDPSWEVAVATSPGSIASAVYEWHLPDPIVSLELTPDGQVVRYLELTSQVRTDRGMGDKPQRLPPIYELDTRDFFTVPDEYRRPPEEGEIARATAVALEFFARHGIAVSGDPLSSEVGEGRRDTRIVNLEWEIEAETPELVRVAVAKERVAAFDRDHRGEQVPETAPATMYFLQVTQFLQVLVLLAAIALIVGMLIVRRRLGEIDFRTTTFVFFFYATVSVLMLPNAFGAALAVTARNGGDVNFWAITAGNIVTVAFMTAFSAGLVAGAWAVGEGVAYTVWPQSLLRPFSAWLRGKFRTSEAAPQVAAGYAMGCIALGIIVLAGFIIPPSPAPSVAPIQALSYWPISLTIFVIALQMGVLVTIFALIFLMTLARSRTRRLWIAIAVGAAGVLGILQPLAAQQYIPTTLVVAAAFGALFAVLLPTAFVRFGPLATTVAIFVVISLAFGYPLVLTGNVAHAASGAWTLVLALVPAAIAWYGTWRPDEVGSGRAVPAHVRRALDRIRITEEFDVARQVQAQFLPSEPPRVAGLDVAGSCVPANEVGGDYFDYFVLSGGRLGIAVGDVSGKGVGAAIYMTLTKSYMVTQAPLATDPLHAIARVNEHLRRNLARGTFVTLAYAIVDARARRLSYLRAGHNPPLLIRANGEGDYLSAPGVALGATGSQMFKATTRVEEVDLFPGDLLLLYTDGVTEAMNARADEYGEERLVALARRLAASPTRPAAIIDALLADIRAFTGRTPQHDDITIVAVRVQ
jgi:serine phosphatase RsbU (regulator of sigma subunit)